MTDLFGNDTPEPRKPAEPAIVLSLIDYAAELHALESGKPLSQIRTEILHPDT